MNASPKDGSRALDGIDTAILGALQLDATISISSLAERVGLSTSACWNRVQRLEADGVITRRVALVDPTKVGAGLCVFVSICTNQHSREWLEVFAEKVSAMPEVVEFYRMGGDVDYMLRVLVSDMDAYDDFYKRLIDGIALADVTSRFAMERIKHTTAVPLPESTHARPLRSKGKPNRM